MSDASSASRQDGEIRATGGCLCGAIRYEVRGPLREVVNCHCGQCRKFHGHFAAYTNAEWSAVTLSGTDHLRWFDSSDFARRGFCATCGSSLFWARRDGKTVSIAAGTLDAPTGLETVGHIFAKDIGDYYQITDGLEARPGTIEVT